MSGVFLLSPTIVPFIGNLFAFAIAYYLTFHKQILKHIFPGEQPVTQLPALGTAFVFSLIAVGFCIPHFLLKFPNVLYRLQTQIGVPESLQPALAYAAVYLFYCTTAPVFFAFFYAFIIRFSVFVTEIYKTSDKIERRFFIAVMLVALVVVTVIYNQTNCFYAPVENETGEIISAEVVYTFDSTCCYYVRYYIPTVLHRPLLHLFFLPFAITAYLCAKILFFIPNTFPVLLCLLQVALLGCTVLLLSRLLHLRGYDKAAFLILCTVLYSILLNAVTLEGYIASTFWLVCFLYLFLEKSRTNHDYAYIAAAGSLVVTGILVVLYVCMSEIRKSIIRITQVLFSFIVFLSIFDNRLLILHLNVAHYEKYTGRELLFYEKLLQWINFIASCFIKPETIVAPPFLKGVGTWMDYQLAPVESLNLLGLALLAFCLLGFVLNYKDKFAQICAFWIAFSFFVLCLVGWGTPENGLILYSLYFGWAYFCLVFLAIEKLLQKLPMVKYTVYTMLLAVLAYINIPGIYDLIQFGIKYYPCS